MCGAIVLLVCNRDFFKFFFYCNYVKVEFKIQRYLYRYVSSTFLRHSLAPPTIGTNHPPPAFILAPPLVILFLVSGLPQKQQNGHIMCQINGPVISFSHSTGVGGTTFVMMCYKEWVGGQNGRIWVPLIECSLIKGKHCCISKHF